MKDFLRKAWVFVWKEDSFASWLVNLVLAFALIKFLVYPLLGLLFGTPYPIVAVVSQSMEHHASFDEWWWRNKDFYLRNNITKSEFKAFPFREGFNKGDLMILVCAKPEDVRVGDVIVYQSGKPYPIIHRVVRKKLRGGETFFETKGDNNKGQIVDFDLDETNVPERVVYGKAVLRIPLLGYVKIWFVDLLRLIAGK